MRRALAVVLGSIIGLASSGCGVMFDLVWLATGPDASQSDTGAERAIEGTDTRWREVSFDPQLGLMCADRAQARTRTSGAVTQVEAPDGYLELMQLALAIDAIALTTIIAVREGACADEDCGPREEFYPWLAPLAVDLMWSLVRSATIHPTIYREMRTSTGEGLGQDAFVRLDPCPVGTVIVLEGERQRASFTIGIEGGLVLDQWEMLARFLASASRLSVEGGGDVRLDASGASAVVVEAERRLEEERRAAAEAAAAAARAAAPAPPAGPGGVIVIPPPPPFPPPPPGGVIIIRPR